MSLVGGDSVAALRAARVAALKCGTARYALVVRLPALGAKPMQVSSGVVDFAQGAFGGTSQTFVGGVHFGRRDDGVWVQLPLGGRHPVGPSWLVELFAGACKACPPHSSELGIDEITASAFCDLFQARRASGRDLDPIYGARRRAMRAIPVAARMESRSLPRHVVASPGDRVISCDLWDYGVDAPLTPPDGAMTLAPEEPFSAWQMARRAGRERRESRRSEPRRQRREPPG